MRGGRAAGAACGPGRVRGARLCGVRCGARACGGRGVASTSPTSCGLEGAALKRKAAVGKAVVKRKGGGQKRAVANHNGWALHKWSK